MNIEYSECANVSASVPAVWHYGTGLVALLCLLFGLFSYGLVIFIFISSILGRASIATTAAISNTRLAVVIGPFSSLKLSSLFTIKRLVCSWLYGAVWIMPPLVGWNRFIFEGFGTTCAFDYRSRSYWDRLFVITLVTDGFLIPLAITFISYTFILITLNGRGGNLPRKIVMIKVINHNQKQTNSLTDVRCQRETIYESYEENTVTRNIRVTEARARRTTLLVCGIFCTAWTPYALMVTLSQ
ncbi:unnamed protein product [Rotaria magnacalcarata]|uniref:G-protein coupled receptors family 1 profile domain-containing protein n=3 Tax=Rotaria magnacalcarata TaxID=392030 RepID=A0A816ZE87_9BILA|nr:unnamed protein product [Rotaria magnacalcarata]CAF3839093.1 unnamed protein product [Rotaria magnacalcarata]